MAARNCVKSLGEKLTKSEKRALRKQKYKIHSFQRHNAELEMSEEPTPHLLVGNGGLMNGVDRIFIVKLFKMFGMVEQVIMVPQRSYSFVTFTNVNDAKSAMDNINGRSLDSTLELGKTGLILYLSYLRRVPDEVINTTHSTPPGLILVENFITEEEEKQLLCSFSLDDEEETGQNENHSDIGMEVIGRLCVD